MTLVGGDLPVRCTPLPVTSTRWVGRPWLQLGLVWLLDKAAKHSTLCLIIQMFLLLLP